VDVLRVCAAHTVLVVGQLTLQIPILLSGELGGVYLSIPFALETVTPGTHGVEALTGCGIALGVNALRPATGSQENPQTDES
jgi:hypothetical protein